MFVERFLLADMRPADYNPRTIDSDARQALARSLDDLGCLKPVILTESFRIIAGHQRSRAMREDLGWTHGPAVVLPELGRIDEIRFNQLHNGADLEVTDGSLRIDTPIHPGWQEVSADAIAGDLRSGNASQRSEILGLLAKFGPWGSSVATLSGELLVSSLYAQACAILGFPLLVYGIAEDRRPAVLEHFGRRYGVFSYDHLEQTPWAQSLCQLFRLRTTGTRVTRGRTYENLVLPRLAPGMRILDFGAGQMDYARMLRRQGVAIDAVEFYLRTPGTMELDLDQVHADISALCDSVAAFGLYDLVIADSVLNSVDSLQAESDVLTCLNAFCKPGGTMIFSGLAREAVDHSMAAGRTSTTSRRRRIQFLDDDGFSAIFRQGVWQYQKYHTQEQVRALAGAYASDTFELYDNNGRVLRPDGSGQTWGVVAACNRDLPEADRTGAITREFDLPLPDGTRYGRHHDVPEALGLSCASEHAA